MWDSLHPQARAQGLCSSHWQLGLSLRCISNWPALIPCWCTPKPQCWLHQNKEIANCMKPVLGGFISLSYCSFLHSNGALKEDPLKQRESSSASLQSQSSLVTETCGALVKGVKDQKWCFLFWHVENSSTAQTEWKERLCAGEEELEEEKRKDRQLLGDSNWRWQHLGQTLHRVFEQVWSHSSIWNNRCDRKRINCTVTGTIHTSQGNQIATTCFSSELFFSCQCRRVLSSSLILSCLISYSRQCL